MNRSLTAAPFPSAIRWASRFSRFPCFRNAEKLERADGGGVPAFNAKLFEHVEDVLLDGVAGGAEDDANFFIVLSLGNPKQHLRFTRGESERLQRNGRRKIGSESHLT